MVTTSWISWSTGEDLSGRSDIKREDIPLALMDSPAYVLKAGIRAWDGRA